MDTAAQSTSNIANIVRNLGVGAVVLSAVLYMFQGIDQIGLEARQWVYVALIAVLAVSGFVCVRLLGDEKSARAALTLALAGLAVQVSQVSGMLHELTTPSGWSYFQGVDAQGTTTALLLTAVVFLPVAYTGFAVLLRRDARTLTFAYGLLNTLLLIPVRSGYGAIAVLAAFIALSVIAQRHAFTRDAALRTLEGYVARGVLLLPAAIAVIRYGVHIETFYGVLGLAGLASITAVTGLCTTFRPGTTRDVGLLLSGLTGACAWVVFASDAFADVAFGGVWLNVLPATMYLLVISRQMISLSALMRMLALLPTVLSVVALLSSAEFAEVVFVIVLSALLGGYGIYYRERETTFAALGLAAYALIVGIVLLVGHINFASYLGLAVGGIALVVSASLVERYGRNVVVRLRSGVRMVSAWR